MADVWGVEDGRSGHSAVLLRVAKRLQGAHARQLTGSQRVWRDVPPEEKEVWIRLARLAERLLGEEEAAAGPGAGTPPGSGQATPPVEGKKPAPTAPTQKPAAKPTKAAPPAEEKPVAVAPAPQPDAKPPSADAQPVARPRPPQSKAARDALATLLRLKTPSEPDE